VPGIFAVGDVNWLSQPGLGVDGAGPSSPVARAFGNETLVLQSQLYPYGIYTIPEISFIGRPRSSSPMKMFLMRWASPYYREIARGQIRGDTTGRLKIVFHREPRHLLGVHIIGEGASEPSAHRAGCHVARRHTGLLHRYGVQLPTLAECYKAAPSTGITGLARAAD